MELASKSKPCVKPFKNVRESFGVYLHTLNLLWQASVRKDPSTAALLLNGDGFSLDQGFSLDGTTFVINREGGRSPIRVPASQIDIIVSKYDYS
jgi:hypothetical protein